MTRPRSSSISLEATPYYHCIARCVRRAFLCGVDQYTGKNFDHRKPWLVARLKLLADVFTIDIAAYAVMSNHYHVVLHVDSRRGSHLSDNEVIQRWTRLYKGPEVIRQFRAGELLSEAEQDLLVKVIQRWRERLCSISWFMGCLNEYLARKANLEDVCKGRFWEARFKSQALLDETALLSCMAYVDLNPVRAGIAEDTAHSDFTSIQDRILEIQEKSGGHKKQTRRSSKPRLMPFGESVGQTAALIPFNLRDYLELVDWTGRIVQQDKRGFISETTPRLLAILRLSGDQWRILALEIQKHSITMLHGLDKLATLKLVTNKVA